MVETRHRELLLKRITDIKTDIGIREKTIEQEKNGLGIFYITQFNKLKEVKDKIEKVENNFEALCRDNTYNEVDGNLTVIRIELNF